MSFNVSVDPTPTHFFMPSFDSETAAHMTFLSDDNTSSNAKPQLFLYLDLTPNIYQTLLLEALTQPGGFQAQFDLHLVVFHDMPEDEAYGAVMGCLSRVRG